MNDNRRDLDLAALKQALLDEKEELSALEAANAEARGTVELDQTRVGRLSRMDALQGQAMALEVERRRKIELVRIDAALKRLENGDYGYCTACDEEIAAKRLQNDPAVPTCIDCARKGG